MGNDSYGFLSGGGPASAKFKAHGDTVGGVITEEPAQQQQRDLETQELMNWKDGNPRMQLVVTIQTDLRDPAIEDDDGKRRLYVKGELKKAVQQAVIAAGARGLDVGGELHVTYTGDGEKTGHLTPPKLYSARYVKPSDSAAAPAEELPEGVTPEAYEALRKLGKVK